MCNLDFMGRIAEGKIVEAIEEGKFDDLPGKGKPIQFDEDPLTPPHLRMVNRILRNANVLPEWVQIQRDIWADRAQVIEMVRKLIRENHKWRVRLAHRPARPGTTLQYAVWHAQSRAAYLKLLKCVNTSVLKFSLVAPSTANPSVPYKIEAEMETLDSEFPLLSNGAEAGNATA